MLQRTHAQGPTMTRSNTPDELPVPDPDEEGTFEGRSGTRKFTGSLEETTGLHKLLDTRYFADIDTVLFSQTDHTSKDTRRESLAAGVLVQTRRKAKAWIVELGTPDYSPLDDGKMISAWLQRLGMLGVDTLVIIAPRQVLNEIPWHVIRNMVPHAQMAFSVEEALNYLKSR